MLDVLLMMALGFLGSFGHCAGMCGPITVAFSLSESSSESSDSLTQQLYFHACLNLGRLLSYGLVGLAMGGLGSVLLAGGQMAGVGSDLRRVMALVTGGLLVWAGLAQVSAGLLPKLPLLHPLTQGKLHQRLSSAMVSLSLRKRWWTPSLLGMVWGLIPCGFLYAAQLKAAETGESWWGALIMLAFGLGTLPTMLGVGISTSLMSRDRRSQLFQAGGWVTLMIGLLTILRTGQMVDYTGHGALVCLGLALVARPLSQLWPGLLRCRRLLGVGGFVLALVHALHMLEHAWGWNWEAWAFLPLWQQGAIAAGIGALVCLLPGALTSSDAMVRRLGPAWRRLHLLALPAWLLAALHTIFLGSHYLGNLTWQGPEQARSLVLAALVLGVLLVRSRWVWSLLSLEKFYGAPPSISPSK